MAKDVSLHDLEELIRGLVEQRFSTKPSVKDSKHCFLVCNLLFIRIESV